MLQIASTWSKGRLQIVFFREELASAITLGGVQMNIGGIVRQHARTTKAETEFAERAWRLHAGDSEPVVRHYIQANRV